ncbi:MAG TPA: hypothetical protein VGQ11_12035, partial [Candidatus Acidoferrales bacterium]|nr:hypothetical protein [Candidatus Acidoferrales bacterium]
MKRQMMAVRLLVFLTLLSFASAGAYAQTAGNNPAPPAAATAPSAIAGQPAQNKAETSAPTAPSAGSGQQKTETPPPQVSTLPQRPLDRPSEPGQTTFEIRYDVQSVSVQGNTERSFLHACTRPQLVIFTPPARPRTCDSINNVAEISFLNNLPVFTNSRFETSIVTRYTDNPRVDPERISLQRGYLRLVSPHGEATLGDSLVNYSRLTFSQNIKGLHAWRQWTDNVRVTGTIGFFADRWGSLYRDFRTFRDITVDCQRASTLGTPPPAGPPFLAAAGCIETSPGSQVFIVNASNPFKPYSRFVAGMRIEHKAGKNGWVALNYSHGKDLLQSLPEAKITCLDTMTSALRVEDIGVGCLATEVEVPGARRPASEAANNHVVSLDTTVDYRAARLKLSGEIARSWTAGGKPPASVVANPTSSVCTSVSSIIGGAVLDARCYKSLVPDVAYRGEATQKIGKLSWRADYSRFGPNFSSANARQIRDLQDFNIRGDYQFRRQFGLTLSWRRSNDNLNGERNFTTVVRAPEVRVAFRELPFYRRLVLEVGYRERNLDTKGDPLTTCVDMPPPPPPTVPPTPPTPALARKVSASIGCSVNPTSGFPETRSATELQIRSTRIPFFSLTMPVKDTMFTLDYEHRHDMDRVFFQKSTDSDRYAFGFRGNYTWNNWDVSPSFRYEIERLAKHSTNDPTRGLTEATLIFPGDFFLANDTNRSFNAQIQIEAPRYFRFEGLFREYNSISLSNGQISATRNPLLAFCVPQVVPVTVPPTAPTFQTCYVNQGFKRPYWRAAVTFKIGNDENRLLTGY